MKNVITIFGAIILLSIVSCNNQISSKEEALEVLKNSEWEEITDTKGWGLAVDKISTYYYFDSDGLVYIYSEKGGFKQKSKSESLSYEIKFTKGKHNVIQICVNGCSNPNKYYLDSDNRNKMVYFGIGRETITRNLKRVN